MVSFSFVQHVPGALPCVSGLRRNAQCLKHPLLEPLGQSGVNVGGGAVTLFSVLWRPRNSGKNVFCLLLPREHRGPGQSKDWDCKSTFKWP